MNRNQLVDDSIEIEDDPAIAVKTIPSSALRISSANALLRLASGAPRIAIELNEIEGAEHGV